MNTHVMVEVTFHASHAGECRIISKQTDSDNLWIAASGPQKQFVSAGTGKASQLARSRRRCDLTQHYRDPDCKIRHQADRELVTLLAQQL
jgi:hypothetical protein